jgi:hypothetical protein
MSSSKIAESVYYPVLIKKNDVFVCTVIRKCDNKKVLFEGIDNINDFTKEFYRISGKMRIAAVCLAYAWEAYPDYCKNNEVKAISPLMMLFIKHRLIKSEAWIKIMTHVVAAIDRQIDDESKQ